MTTTEKLVRVGRVLRGRATSLARRFHRDESAQAMTEAALMMPLVVLVFLAAHEFMYMNEWKFLVGRSTRFIAWEMTEHFNYPLDGHYDDISYSDVKKADADPKWIEFSRDAHKMFFAGKIGIPDGDSWQLYYLRPSGTDYAFGKSFNFDSDLSEGGGDPDKMESDMSSGDPGSAGGFASFFSSIAGSVTSIAGEAVTGVSLNGTIRFGPELPTRGFVQSAYTIGWEPLFLAILTPAPDVAGTSQYAFYGAEGGNARFDSEIAKDSVRSGDGVVAIGNDPGVDMMSDDNKKRAWARYCLLSHDYRTAVPSGSERDLDQGNIHWRVKGWTLLGALSASYSSSGGGGGGGLMSSIMGFLSDNFFPFKCCLRMSKLGRESEDGDLLTEDYPTF